MLLYFFALQPGAFAAASTVDATTESTGSAAVGSADAGAIYLPLVRQPLGRVYISEFMASNDTTLLDEDGESSDWIELHNADSTPVDLTGWYLTDDPDDLTKWRFPIVVLNPDQYLVIFASDKNRADSVVRLHTNFRLSADGEYLALVAPDGKTVASAYAPQYPPQTVDVSYGMDTAQNQRYYVNPTPWGANGTGSSDQGPSIADVQHYPNVPQENENMLVLARVTGTPALVTLHYRVMFNADNAVPMYDDGNHGDGAAGDGFYGAIIPHAAYRTGELVRYAVSAADYAGRESRVPVFDDSDEAPRYLGTVPGADSYVSQLPILHWFVGSPHKAEDRDGTRASVFYDGRYYDNIFVRLRGGIAVNWPKKNFKFDFNQGDHFLFSPDEDPVEEFNLNSTWSDKAYVRRVLAWETYRDAGSPYSISFPLRVHQNGEFYSVAIFVEQPDERYLVRQGLDPDGALYKMYTSLTSSDDQDKTGSAQKRTRLYEDKSDLQAFIDGLNLPDAERSAFLFDNVDLPQVINYLAATSIMHDNDHVAKNYYLYRDSNGDLEWMMLPWDKDLTFGRNYTGEFRYMVDTIWADDDPYSHPLFGDSDHRKVDDEWNHFIDVLYAEPRIREMYLRRLRTLMDELLQPPGTPYPLLRYEQRMDELYEQMKDDVALDTLYWPIDWGSEQDFQEALTILKTDYLAVRRQHLFVNHGPPDGDIPAAQTTSPRLEFGPFEFGYGSPNQDTEYLTLQNPNDTAVDISGWRLAGVVEYRFPPGMVIPAGDTLYVSPNVRAFRSRLLSPRGGEGHLVHGGYSGRISHRSGEVRLLDDNDVQIARLQYLAATSRLADQLRVTEINYHPPDMGARDGNDFEFIELQNASDSVIELSGLRFVDGIDHAFAPQQVAPGEHIVLARDAAAFALRYPDMTPVGYFTKKLANDGERITLIDGAGYPIFTLKYADDGLWPPSADGDGPTLVRTAPYLHPSNPCEWRASATVFGSPGRADEPGPDSLCSDTLYLPLSANAQ